MSSLTIDIAAIRGYLLQLQFTIVAALETFDGEKFLHDPWNRPARKVLGALMPDALEGDGMTRVMEDGAFFERGSCNFSHVRGSALPASALQI